ncbi:MAG: phospholipase C [Paraglaciecola sp.]|jgi:phospholipase C
MSQLNRRQFLAGASLTGLAASFPEIARALAIPANNKTGSIEDVEHVVILMQENRSFDHYFGTMSGVRGFSDPYPAPTLHPDGKSTGSVMQQALSQSANSPLLSPFHLNTKQTFDYMRVEGTPHTWPDAQAAWDQGRMAHWPAAKTAHSMGYFTRDDIPFQFALAEAFTVCDAYHSSIQSSTNPNRLFLWSATVDGEAKNGGPGLGNSHDNLPANGGAPSPYTWTTYVERLDAAGIDWQIYQDMNNNFTDNPLVGFKAFQDSVNNVSGANPRLSERALQTRDIEHLKADIKNHNLPAVSYIIATAEGSEHPGPSSPAQGAAYISELLAALTADPEVWSRTALFIMFDENDGFFDHVPPPAPPSKDPLAANGFAGESQVSTAGEYHNIQSQADAELERTQYMGRPYGLGARVPAYVISPWTRGGFINSEVLDHTSVTRFLEARFGVIEPNISPWRRAVCGDFLNAFDFTRPNDALFPTMPDTSDDAKRAAALPERTTPVIPANIPPAEQEQGKRSHRPCLYNLALEWKLNPKQKIITLNLKNNGSRAAVFHVYDRHNLDAIPRRYTIKGNSQLSASFSLHDDLYDLQIMGPEGFHRRLGGNAQTALLEITLEQVRQGFNLGTSNSELLYRLGQNQAAKSLNKNHRITVTSDENQGYDLTITSKQEPGFIRQFAGRMPINLWTA